MNNDKLISEVNKISGITEQLDTKVSKGEGGVITNTMLSQEVKESMTGGSVAVVGKDTILEENIVDNQVTAKKINDKIFTTLNNNSIILDEDNMQQSTYSNAILTTGYILDVPISSKTVDIISDISLYCKKGSDVTPVPIYVGVGYYNDSSFVITSVEHFNCKIGVNMFKTNIKLTKNVDNYIICGGNLAFNSTSKYSFSEITNYNFQTGSYTPVKSPSILLFGISAFGKSETHKRISVIEDNVSNIQNTVDTMLNTLSLPNNYEVLFNETFKSVNTNMTYENCTASNGLILQATSSCYENTNVAYDDYIYSATFKINTLNSIFGFETFLVWQSKYLVDIQNKKLNIYLTTGVAKSVDIPFNFNVGDRYVLKLKRDGWSYVLSLVNLATLDEVKVSFENFSNTTTRLYCRGGGQFGVTCKQGEVLCENLTMRINYLKECECLIIGDSLTEGDQVDNIHRWGRGLKTKLFRNSCCVAGQGGNPSSVISVRLKDYISKGVKFKYCIVLAGMNNRSDAGLTSWKTKIDEMYNDIVTNGGVPIIAINPIPISGGNYILEMRDYVLSKGWYTIRFDIALSKNKDGITYEQLYFNTDGVHPNNLGNDIMYDTALKTITKLIY